MRLEKSRAEPFLPTHVSSALGVRSKSRVRKAVLLRWNHRLRSWHCVTSDLPIFVKPYFDGKAHTIHAVGFAKLQLRDILFLLL